MSDENFTKPFHFQWKSTPEEYERVRDMFRDVFNKSDNVIIECDGKRYSVNKNKLKYVNKVIHKHWASIRNVERTIMKYCEEVK